MDAQEFRNCQINAFKDFFEREIKERNKLYTNYKKAYSVTDWISMISAVFASATCAGGAVMIPLVVSLPASIALEVVGFTSGGICLLSNYVNKTFRKKAEKHHAISVLATHTLNTINALISKAKDDNEIDDCEFSLVTTEYAKYIELKNKTIERDLTNEEKNTLKKEIEDIKNIRDIKFE